MMLLELIYKVSVGLRRSGIVIHMDWKKIIKKMRAST